MSSDFFQKPGRVKSALVFLLKNTSLKYAANSKKKPYEKQNSHPPMLLLCMLFG